MEQPEGFEEEGKEDYVWVLQQGLYGMKQSGCIWNQTMNDVMGVHETILRVLHLLQEN